MYNNLLQDENSEDARAVLPNACCTELYMTANARALIEMSYLRICNRAQKEIRTMFGEIKKRVSIVAPEVAEWMVPQCEKNNEYPFCTEKKSCGKHKTLKDIYACVSYQAFKEEMKQKYIEEIGHKMQEVEEEYKKI